MKLPALLNKRSLDFNGSEKRMTILMENTINPPKGKILIVDDREVNLRLLEAMLTPLGHKVYMAHNGKECLDAVVEINPDLILLDVMMPIMDGLATLIHLKSNPATKSIPVIMVTALTELKERINALEKGADDFLSKPINELELKARVNSLLNIKAYHDHLKNHKERLESEVTARTQDLQQAYATIKRTSFETIFRLSRAAEFKDDDTGEHIVRMGHFAGAIARQMGLQDQEIENIFYGAPMHDVGKIATPDAILRKPGKLNAEEWKIMQQHCEQGALILANPETELLTVAETIAISHHEKWDGSGYPKGLAGADIPLAGRITAIADVFDALTSKRPYKEPFSIEKSFAIIRESRGGHFDPAVVDAFFTIEKEILQIKKTYGNK